MLLCLYKRRGQVKSLKTDKAEEIFNVTEKKTNSITDIFFVNYYLDLGLMQLHSREIFSENGWSRRKELRSDSDSLWNNNSV